MRMKKTYKYEMTWWQKNQILMWASYFKHMAKDHETPVIDSIIKMMEED